MQRRTSLVFVSLSFVMVMVSQIPRSGDADIHLDGIIGKNEWAAAKEYPLKDGGKLYLYRENTSLYVALTSNKKGWGHVYLAAGDTIRVLHASAALGEARYVKQTAGWHPVQAFKWELRGKDYNDTLIKEQQRYYQQNGWVANNNNTGDGKTLEFKLDLARNGQNPALFACLILSDPSQPHFFPGGLSDNTLLPQLLMQGNMPDLLQFDTGGWERVEW